MYRGLRLCALSVTAVSLMLCTTARATTITSTTLATWKLNLTGIPAEINIGTVGFSSFNTAAGVTLSGYTFTGPDNGGYSLTGAIFNGFASLVGSTGPGAAVNVATPVAGANAFLIGAGTTGSTPVTVTLSDGETFSMAGGGTFLGLSISHPVTSIQFTTTSGSGVAIDDFWFGTSSLAQDSQTSPTPEGGTLILFSGGILVLAGAWQKLGTSRRF